MSKLWEEEIQFYFRDISTQDKSLGLLGRILKNREPIEI